MKTQESFNCTRVPLSPNSGVRLGEQRGIMSHTIAKVGAATLVVLLLASCDSHDSDYIPYGLKGMNVYVYNNDTDKEFYAGHVEGSYLSKDEALNNCQSLAYSVVRQNHLDNWSYICCTETSSSSCATKVR